VTLMHRSAREVHGMLDTTARLVVPPAPPIPQRPLSALALLIRSIDNVCAIWPERAFDELFLGGRLFGIDSAVVNDPQGVRYVMATNAANYVRPAMFPRMLRPLGGRGVLLAEGAEWRRQRRLLSPSFTPHHMNILIPHFISAAHDLVRTLERAPHADLSGAFRVAALDAVLRALFSMPDHTERDRLAGLVREYVIGPGRPGLFDRFARTETSFAFSLGRRRSFQRRWFAAVDAIVAARRSAPHEAGHRDLLDLLIAARDPHTGEPLAADEVRDQCATMIFAGYGTTARLMFWASYLLTLDHHEQARLRAEVATFPPERVATLDDLDHWPRLRLVLLEALRLYPPVAVLARQAVHDDHILGEPVRRGAQVFISPWILHRHRKFWQHPTAFVPDRFAGQSSPFTSGGAYLPFGAGPRICIGAVFSLCEAQIMLAMVLHRCTLTLASRRPVLPVGRFTLQPNYAPVFKVEPTHRAGMR